MSEAKLAELISEISHDLKSPLASIRAMVFIMGRKGKLNKSSSDFLKKIDEKTIFLNTQIEALTLVSSIKGRKSLSLSFFNIDDLLKEILEENKDYKILLSQNLIKEEILGDKEKIKFVIKSVLVKADKEKDIDIKVSKKNNFVKINFSFLPINSKKTVIDLASEKILELHNGGIDFSKGKVEIKFKLKN